MRIRTKMTITFGILFFIIFLAGSLFLFITSSNTINTLRTSLMEQNLSRVSEMMQTYNTSKTTTRETAVTSYMRGIAEHLYNRVENLWNSYQADDISREEMENSIRNIILSTKIVDTGYAFGMNTNGVLTIHKSAEGKDLSSREHIQQIMKNKNGVIEYTAATTGQSKIVVYRYFKPLDMIIAPGVNIQELTYLYDKKSENELFNKMKKSIQNIHIGETAHIHVLDKTGNIRITTSTDKKETIQKTLPESFPKDKNRLTYTKSAGMSNSGAQSDTSGASHSENGTTYLMLYNTLEKSGDTVLVEISMKELKSFARQFGITTTILIGAALLAIFFLVFIISNSLVKPVSYVSGKLEEISEGAGDLTQTMDIPTKDEIGDLSQHFNNFISKLDELINQLKDVSDANRNQATSLGSETQEISSSVEEISASISSMRDKVQKLDKNLDTSRSELQEISQSANTVKSKADSQVDSVSDSSSAIEQMVSSIGNISKIANSRNQEIKSLRKKAQENEENIDRTRKAIASINQSADSIQEFLTLINGVAEQTNILAMNAAIEAAHAGEEGKGFSVVAEEIRKLSENTTEHSRKISESVGQIIEEINDTDKITETTATSFQEVNSTIHSLSDSLQEMVSGLNELSEGTSNVTDSIERLSSSAEELRSASSDITKRTGVISESIEEVSNHSNESSQGMEEIADGIQEISHSMSRITELGNSAVTNIKNMDEVIFSFTTTKDSDGK